MDKKTIFGSLLSLALTVLLLATTVYAWFTLQSHASIESFVIDVHEMTSSITLEVSKNGEDFVELITQEDFNAIFADALPSNTFLFKLTIENQSTRSTTIKVVLHNIENDNVNVEFDMRDVFFLDKGIISLDGDDLDPLEIENEDPNPEFDDYCLNNLLLDGDIILIDDYSFEIDQDVVIMFTIIYDENTSAIEYQAGKLHISAIYIYNN